MKIARAEFERLALEQIDLLDRIARALTRDVQKGEDLVQETYLHALKAADSFDLQTFGMRPWLVRIMHNLHFTRTRRDKHQPALMDEELLARVENSPHQKSASGNAFAEAIDERIARALDTIAPEYQTVLMLWAIDELSYKEIADALDIPVGTVMSRLYRARQRLAEKLTDLAADHGIKRK